MSTFLRGALRRLACVLALGIAPAVPVLALSPNPVSGAALYADVWGALQGFLNDGLDGMRRLADQARSLRDLTGDAKRDLWGESSDMRRWGAAQGNAFVDDALARMLSGGDMPDVDELRQAVEGAVAGLDPDRYVDLAQLDVDRAILAAKLGAIEQSAGVRLTEGEQQIGLLEEQLQAAQRLIDVSRGIHESVQSTDGGVARLAQLLAAEAAARAAAEQARAAAAAAAPAPSYGGGGGGGGGYGGGAAPAPAPAPAPTALQREIAHIRAASWYGSGRWDETRGHGVAALAGSVGPDGMDQGDMAMRLYAEGMAIRDGIVITRAAAEGLQAEIEAIRASWWYGNGDWTQARGSTVVGLAGASPR